MGDIYDARLVFFFSESRGGEGRGGWNRGMDGLGAWGMGRGVGLMKKEVVCAMFVGER